MSESGELLIKLNLQFFAQEGPGGEKTEEPTAKKLQDAREEGQVAKSKELASSFTLLAMFILLKIWTGSMASRFISVFSVVYNKFSDFTKVPGGRIEANLYISMLTEMFIRILTIALPFVISAFIIAFVADVAQVGFKPTSKPLKPKLSKINPINGFKRIFSVQTLVELIKSILKLAVIFIIIFGELERGRQILFMLYDVPLTQAVILAGDYLIGIGIKIAAVFMVIAFADFLFQKWKFHNDMKMTKQEVKEEYKSTEGDPQIKGKIRQRMMQASQRRMMQNLPKADVVITNPTHFAVALKYDKEEADAPVVVAKGADYLAAKIKEAAREHDVSIVENKPLARALYHNVEIGEQIPPELYETVAQVLAGVYRAKGLVS
ncbi:MAG: flagellar biosynthesis protein FlhB [Lachnospiraceae bacterium]|nr:flagellar biosynthesis protein FlhB [Lachnospiraceae bacterium]